MNHPATHSQTNPVDFLIIGSGFGGSVSALRLVEKGYRVHMLEKGRRLNAADFPKTNWDLKRWLWLPQLGWRGLFRMTFLPHITALTGVGVGGGSLVYANTLPRPPPAFFTAAPWGHLATWQDELMPHYETAEKMLGVTTNPILADADHVLENAAQKLGHHSTPTPVGIYFGKPHVQVDDPYFNGQGPTRTGCTACGGCMLGCRHNAKNTLDKNYLYLAEKLGLTLDADTEATWVEPTTSGYIVSARQTGKNGTRHLTFYARNVIFAGGVLGTLDLLLRLQKSQQGLPNLSSHLGTLVRTNSEALIGVTGTRADQNMSKGIAIGSIVNIDAYSNIEAVRYPEGSNFFRALGVPHVGGATLGQRILAILITLLTQPAKVLRALLVSQWAQRTIILLYMRAEEGHLQIKHGRRWLWGFSKGLTTRVSAGERPKASIADATRWAQVVAQEIRGQPMSLLSETLFNIPTTAHLMGGCPMGHNKDDGVIDSQHRVFGYTGLYVVDGSTLSANPGVNPSLTICALAERAMQFIAPKKVD